MHLNNEYFYNLIFHQLGKKKYEWKKKRKLFCLYKFKPIFSWDSPRVHFVSCIYLRFNHNSIKSFKKFVFYSICVLWLKKFFLCHLFEKFKKKDTNTWGNWFLRMIWIPAAGFSCLNWIYGLNGYYIFIKTAYCIWIFLALWTIFFRLDITHFFKFFNL